MSDKTDKTDKMDKVIDKTYVATPDELIDFVANSIKHIAKTEFGKDMHDKDVEILDPFAGKGEFFNRMSDTGFLEKGKEYNLTAYELSKKRYDDMVKEFKKRNLKVNTKNIDTFET
ncbi:MAG: hypothetical protein OXC46_00930, partial [Thaumarchaeota archaeon]|nr:hypothetical protein [Nitrososphaerota archaeon]